MEWYEGLARTLVVVVSAAIPTLLLVTIGGLFLLGAIFTLGGVVLRAYDAARDLLRRLQAKPRLPAVMKGTS